MKHIDKMYYSIISHHKISMVAFILLGMVSHAQDPIHNFGNLKIHTDAVVGFHHDFINDGFADENEGLAGFYSSDELRISGAFRPIFQDMEIMVANHLYLDVGVGVTNNSNFILGNVVTPRNLIDTHLEYRNQAFYTGETDATKVDGYATVNNKQNFTFPIGNSLRFRPLKLSSNSSNNSAKSAYFEEDPNSPSTFSTSFNTDIRTDILLTVSTFEFWDLDSELPSTVTLTWDTVSNLPNFIDELQNLRIVGWNTLNGIWEDLGASSITGDLTTGSITSNSFVPDDFSVITFGAGLDTKNITLENYYMSANGDGINDFLVIDAVSASPRNRLRIFNRWGKLVYLEKDYKREFVGVSNVSLVFSKNSKLPSGVYFYVIDLLDLGTEHQGFLYLNY